MTFDPALKIWNAASEADFEGWQLRSVEKLPVDRHEQSYLVTIRKDNERREVYVAREPRTKTFVYVNNRAGGQRAGDDCRSSCADT